MKTATTKNGRGRSVKTAAQKQFTKEMLSFVCPIIRAKRNELGFTQREMADKLDMTEGAYANMESYKATSLSGIETLYRFFKVLNISFSMQIDGKEIDIMKLI